MPQAIRKIVTFIWHYEYMGYPMTLKLFKVIFKIEYDSNKPYYTARVINQAIVWSLIRVISGSILLG